MTMTDRDMTKQVEDTLTEYVNDYYVPAIVRKLIEKYGVVNIESIPDDEFWLVVWSFEKPYRG